MFQFHQPYDTVIVHTNTTLTEQIHIIPFLLLHHHNHLFPVLTSQKFSYDHV